MADNIDDQTNNDQTNNDNTNTNNNTNTPDVEALVKARVDEALKDIKDKLNKAYGARDEALKKIAEFEQRDREAELKRLQEEGRHKEAFELQLAEERARREALEKQNTELTRDLQVRNALSAQPFRNDNALEMAYREIVGQLVRNEQGVWVHKSGVSIKDYVKTFTDSAENEFLFKPKVSNGAGSGTGKPADTSGTSKKSLFEMTQEEVIKLAQEGKLPKRN
jgi:hypothetical protein